MFMINRLINYQGSTYKPNYYLTTYKLLLIRFISTNGACFVCIYLSNFYLITPFNKKNNYAYFWIPEWVIHEDIMDKYNIKTLIQNFPVLDERRA